MSTLQQDLAIVGGKPIRDSFLVFGSPLIEEAEIEEVVRTMRSGWLGTGPRVKEFEEAFGAYIGAKHALALNSCTAGLHLALEALDLNEGDEVITTAMTFCATANTVIHAGGIPVFADCDRDTWNIDPADIERKITPHTKAIVPVHYAGRPCDMEAIMAIAEAHDLRVIEDCAHAVETEYKGRHAGTFGDMASFSFYSTKNIVTGEGGMVTTNNPEYAEIIKVRGLHGMSRDAWKRFSAEGFKHYDVVYPGYKYNMMDLQAAIGIHQLKRIEAFSERRAVVWQRYMDAFQDLPLFLPAPFEANTRHALHLFTILVDVERLTCDRDTVLNALIKENIGVGVHYRALHEHPYYAERFDYKPADFPNAKFVSDRTISLPISAKLSDQDVEDVITAVHKVLSYYGR